MDREHHNPPEIRDDILKLPELAKGVVNHGMKGCAPVLFELATKIEDQFSDIREARENIQHMIAKLTNLQPESLKCGD